ncbi:hypothetical protein D1007_27516 [Hordeum vulgare]|nr:hypothetical protein D1007_27516 [Hordeum vulgare]
MALTSKKGKFAASATSSTTAAPALMPSRVSQEDDLGPMIPLVAGDTNEGRVTDIWSGSEASRSLVNTAYPFFLHNIFVALVSLFCDFFYAIPSHYQIQALHLQPNSILLFAIFNFYSEGFMKTIICCKMSSSKNNVMVVQSIKCTRPDGGREKKKRAIIRAKVTLVTRVPSSLGWGVGERGGGLRLHGIVLIHMGGSAAPSVPPTKQESPDAKAAMAQPLAPPAKAMKASPWNYLSKPRQSSSHGRKEHISLRRPP